MTAEKATPIVPKKDRNQDKIGVALQPLLATDSLCHSVPLQTMLIVGVRNYLCLGHSIAVSLTLCNV